MTEWEKSLIGAGMAGVIYFLFNIGKLIERQISEQQKTQETLKLTLAAIKKLEK
ncbi:hypothetical protein [uncultured Desulfuromonas sp.]|uniref:hypothetical protein n=1 Tax=uncultured Desulfuromonas sp. TaxID=181013 RepID=UPI0026350249|nr:hypothetical protein [uncultured Desulfuromonas sp.]